MSGWLAQLREDIDVVLEKDPAARNPLEVLLYPGLHALWAHRLAHRLYLGHVPFLPRMVSQIARVLTGGIEIDRACSRFLRGDGRYRRPSCASRRVLRCRPPPKPVSEPSAPITRWQGITSGMRFVAFARPTARAAPGLPTIEATCA